MVAVGSPTVPPLSPRVGHVTPSFALSQAQLQANNLAASRVINSFSDLPLFSRLSDTLM